MFITSKNNNINSAASGGSLAGGAVTAQTHSVSKALDKDVIALKEATGHFYTTVRDSMLPNVPSYGGTGK